MRVHEMTLFDNKALLISDELQLTAPENAQYIILENIKSIPANTFLNCRNLKKIILPADLREIHHDAFNGCRNLEFRLPESLEFLGTRAFAGIKSNCNLIIPSSLNNIQTDCFMYTKFNRVVIQEGVYKLGDIFRGAQIHKLVLPRSLEYIANSAIEACDEIICYTDSMMEEFCKKNFRRKISIRGGTINAKFK